MQRPPRSQSPNRVGSSPSGPSISLGRLPVVFSPVRDCSSDPDASLGWPLRCREPGPVSLPDDSDIRLSVPEWIAVFIRPSVEQPLNYLTLNEMGIVAVSGTEAREFLQGQLTQDMEMLEPGGSVLAGWADAKGRLLFAGTVAQVLQEFWMIAPVSLCESIASRLSMFVLRAKVRIEILALPVAGVFGYDANSADHPGDSLLGVDADPSDSAPGLLLVPHPNAADRAWLLGAEPSLIDSLEALVPVADPQAWEREEVLTGVPAIVPETSGRFVPQMVNLDLLAGISFTKGCYSGQEIVARTQNLGRIKRRMFRFSTSESWTPVAGETLFENGKATGIIVRGVSDGTTADFLAVVPLASASTKLSADPEGNRPLTRQQLPYWPTDPDN